jgi:hypothetical protein
LITEKPVVHPSTPVSRRKTGWLEKGFLTLPYLSLEMKNATRI